MVANEYGGYAGDHGGRGMRGYGPRGRIPLPPYGPVPPAYDDGPLETAQVCRVDAATNQIEVILLSISVIQP